MRQSGVAGVLACRVAGRMRHFGVGAAHQRTRVLAIADDSRVTVIKSHTAEVMRQHDSGTGRAYSRNKQKDPGRWPGSGSTSDATGVSPILRLIR